MAPQIGGKELSCAEGGKMCRTGDENVSESLQENSGVLQGSIFTSDIFKNTVEVLGSGNPWDVKKAVRNRGLPLMRIVLISAN